ncbi:MAG TPA: protein kinase [Solirubrobacteraceae bacterium]|nr:protein kinase [Solirubrobacteraceae bacterium]
MARTTARRVGRYEIVREIGRGGMATVYLARQTDLQRDVALKELSLFDGADPALARRFLREARLAGSLGHPNIVTVYDYIEYRGRPYIAMEYVPGGSLRPHVGLLSLAQIGGVLDGLLSGLAFAEERRVVHRDLKPENIMVTAQGWVKIADFGIAKATSEAQVTANLTTTGTTLGTPRYMAPERALGEDVGPWSDLYSVGIMAFELLAGRTPFHDTDEPMAVLMRQINEEVPPVSSVVPDVDHAISDWVQRLLIKDPAARTRSAATAWDELEDVLTSLLGPRWMRQAGLPATPGGSTTTLRQTPRRRPAPRAEPVAAPRSERVARPRAEPVARPRTEPAATPRAQPLVAPVAVEDRTVAPLTIPLADEQPRPGPRTTRRTARRAVRRATQVRRLAAVLAVLIIGVATATMAGGGAPPSSQTGSPATVDAAPLGALDQRTSAHRAQLASARTGREQRDASRALAGDFSSAARAVEREGGGRRLAASLDAVARSYRQAAAAAERGDVAGYARARARARRDEAAIREPEPSSAEDPGGEPSPAQDAGGEPTPSEDDSGVGDSRSDDPSDDEPDEEEDADGP